MQYKVLIFSKNVIFPFPRSEAGWGGGVRPEIVEKRSGVEQEPLFSYL